MKRVQINSQQIVKHVEMAIFMTIKPLVILVMITAQLVMGLITLNAKNAKLETTLTILLQLVFNVEKTVQYVMSNSAISALNSSTFIKISAINPVRMGHSQMICYITMMLTLF